MGFATAAAGKRLGSCQGQAPRGVRVTGSSFARSPPRSCCPYPSLSAGCAGRLLARLSLLSPRYGIIGSAMLAAAPLSDRPRPPGRCEWSHCAASGRESIPGKGLIEASGRRVDLPAHISHLSPGRYWQSHVQTLLHSASGCCWHVPVSDGEIHGDHCGHNCEQAGATPDMWNDAHVCLRGKLWSRYKGAQVALFSPLFSQAR